MTFKSQGVGEGDSDITATANGFTLFESVATPPDVFVAAKRALSFS